MKTSKKLFLLLLITGAALVAQQKTSGFPTLTGPYLGQKPPGNTPELFAAGVVSTGINEVSICFSEKGNEVFFVVSPPSRMPRIILTSKMVDSKWTEFEEVSFFDSERSNSYPFLAQDSKKLYFNAWQPKNEMSDLNGQRTHEIWYTERANGEWSKTQKIDFGSKYKSIGTFPSVAANGNMYFSARHGGSDADIYYSKFTHGGYSIPDKLSSAINSPEGESHACIAADESYLIFDSVRKNGSIGGQDLYISFKGKSGLWTKAINLGPRINSPYAELRPWISLDGSYLFFISDRPAAVDMSASAINKNKFEALFNESGNGDTDVYWVDAKFINEIKRKELE